MNNSSDSKANERARRQQPLSKPTEYDDALRQESFRSQPFVDEQSIYPLSGSDAPQTPLLTDKKQRSLVAYNHLTYLLYVLSYFTAGLLWIVPIVMNYAKRHDADHTWLATHFDWQIKTFWYSIVLFAVGALLILFAVGGLGIGVIAESNNLAIGSIVLTGLGLLIIAFTFIWHLYRIVRGWIALTDNRPVP